MKLPAGETAYVPVDKLAKYLLAPEHPVGRSKAHVLQAAGFDRRTVGLRERTLIEIAQTRDVQTVTLTPYGVKYVVEGTIRGPSGREVNLRTVWIVEEGDERPRFVTAHPSRRREEASDDPRA